ncbi:restriction endonuclease [Luteimonas sp. MC1828]|uniref:restriction endonuclease n=1 Tax=Luteimonas sp. MC1828 TaxID=2799787 RepID=UPI0018F1682C|nr:restriction endonuclease [Luteimonas sp. MC1828]MBJ7573816.1 restriction endonuclease [Luteimonas sp. MC1828]
MGRRKKSGLDEVASWPWPVGILAGMAAFLVIRYGIGAYLSAGGPVLRPVGQQIGAVLAPLAWIVMLACWLAAGASWMNARQRRTLHDTRTNLDSLASISWREFEMLVGESYRRQGYEVVENGLGGKDGGIDLILSRAGRRELVQCKQWKRRQVDASTVREMWGLVDHHGADAVHIVSAGSFTADARRFAQGKHIYLVTGNELFERIQMAQATIHRSDSTGAPATNQALACPRCSGAMVERHNRRTGERFMGCSRFPQCKGTAPA